MRRHILLGAAVVFATGILLSTGMAFGQQQGGGQAPPPTPPSGGGGTPGGGPTTPTTPGTTPLPGTRDPFPQRQQTPREEPQIFPEMQRIIYLSGKVIMEDGSPPPDNIVIERVCGGIIRPEAYTDSKGRFSFQLGQNSAMIPDASVGSMGGMGGMGGFGNSGSSRGGSGTGGISERDLAGCELRATLPGYRSDVVNLAGRRSLDNPDVGTIVMRRLGNVEGTTISMTSLNAPKDAKKAFDKGREAVRKKKWADAQRELEKAVQIYPKYATAWFELGRVHEQNNNLESARKAYGESLSADAKFVNPYMQLAGLAAKENRWDEVADTTDRLLKLNPFDFPGAYFYNSVANFNLQRFDAAEKSALEASKLDTQHRIPKIEHLLGAILATKRDYTGAAAHMKNYLQYAPNATDTDTVKKQLAELERLSGGAATVRTVPQP